MQIYSDKVTKYDTAVLIKKVFYGKMFTNKQINILPLNGDKDFALLTERLEEVLL